VVAFLDSKASLPEYCLNLVSIQRDQLHCHWENSQPVNHIRLSSFGTDRSISAVSCKTQCIRIYPMKKIAILVAAASAMIATPALASGQGRAEIRGGLATASGQEEAFLGVGAGYDFDLGDSAFVGAEVGADKVLVDGSEVLFSVGGRIGAKAGEKTRVYAAGGMGFSDGESDPYLGAGAEFGIGSKAYGKVEYRRVLTSGGIPDVNFFGIGAGIRF
jgi:outer membrane immunogenic protein